MPLVDGEMMLGEVVKEWQCISVCLSFRWNLVLVRGSARWCVEGVVDLYQRVEPIPWDAGRVWCFIFDIPGAVPSEYSTFRASSDPASPYICRRALPHVP